MDRSTTSSEIWFHGLPSKSKRPSIRKQITFSLSSQLIVLFLRNSHLQRDIWQIFFRKYFCKLLENSCSASKKLYLEIFSRKSSEKDARGESYFSKVAGFYRSSQRRCFIERCSQNSQENTCIRDAILKKVAGIRL